jgi:PAS domain S-box-containing protein
MARHGDDAHEQQQGRGTLAAELRALRESVEEKLRRQNTDGPAKPDQLESLHRALEELRAEWENVHGQSERLANERQHYADLFKLAPDAYLVTDSSGNISEANVAAQKLLRLSAPHLGGKPLQLFLSEANRNPFRTKLNELLCQSTGTAKSWWGELRKGDGALSVEFTVAVIGDAAGKTRLCWVLRPGTALP